MMLSQRVYVATEKRNRLRPTTEVLETRLALSNLTATVPAPETSQAITVTMPARANGMINGVATHRVMVVQGHTSPSARVQLEVDHTMRVTRAGVHGNYQFRLPMPPGSYALTVNAKNQAGGVSSATMTTSQGDAVIAWINTMIDVVRSDISNVGLVSRTMAMVSAAVYDSVNDIERNHAVFKINVQAPRWASPQAAASEAAYTVLSSLYPDQSPMLDTMMAESLAAVPGRTRPRCQHRRRSQSGRWHHQMAGQRRFRGEHALCPRNGPRPVASDAANVHRRLGAGVGECHTLRHHVARGVPAASAAGLEQCRIRRGTQPGRVAGSTEQHNPHAR